jgi:hypothetical protein
MRALVRSSSNVYSSQFRALHASRVMQKRVDKNVDKKLRFFFFFSFFFFFFFFSFFESRPSRIHLFDFDALESPQIDPAKFEYGLLKGEWTRSELLFFLNNLFFFCR